MNEYLERVLIYCDDIINNKIVHCLKHRWAVKRFLKMYELAQVESNYYYFDEDVIEDFYWWAYEFRHVEGVLAGQRVELTDITLFEAAGILCFKKKKNNARLVRKVYSQKARKNMKSQFEAILGSYIAFIGDEKQRMYIAGWTRDQSSEVYEAVRNGIQSSELLKGKWKESYGKIKVFNNNSEIVPLSKEARKTGDGKNPSVAVIDEYHAHETSEIYDVMVSGMVARKEPLIVVITTAGFNLSVPCFSEYEYASEILNPDSDTENDEYFVLICELDKEDDIKDESVWMKANPIVCTYEEGIDSIRSELKVALDQPEKMRSFLTKNMNLWVDQKEDGYMDMSKWNSCEVKSDKNMAELIDGWNIYVGLDLSMTTDLTSVGIVAVKNGKFRIFQHSFMPGDMYNERMSRDKVRYDLFVDGGYLERTEGNVVDYRFVKQWIINFFDRVSIKELGYDKWNALHLAQELEAAGVTVVEIPQNISHLSIPTKEFREAVYSGKVEHFGDPLLKWAVNNAVLKMDEQENVMIGKKVSKNRIDPIAAVINAYARAMYDDQKVDLNEYIMSDGFSF